ncbi:hypothetical protein ACQQ2T_08680 [Paraclostridium tenue]
MFTIDFTKPFLYKDVIYFNQGNLAANNILRCKLVTGGDETLEGYVATVTFKTSSNLEINESVNIVDTKNCIVDIKFPSNSLEVGVNELEVILTKGEGIDKVVTPFPVIKYEVWQCLTTGNGIQGDSNYPILIDLISEVNATVRIANNASATADASLKQTAKMLDVVNDNIAKANEAIDNTNSAKDEALNAVEEVNSVKGNLISEVNAAKNSMVEDINSTKNTVVADVNQAKNDMEITVDEAIKFLKQEFNSLTAQQQEELELLQARDGEVNLNTRLERDLYIDGKSLKQEVLDLEGLKESQEMAYSTDKGYLTCRETKVGTVKDLKLKGKSLVNVLKQPTLTKNITSQESDFIGVFGRNRDYPIDRNKEYFYYVNVKKCPEGRKPALNVYGAFADFMFTEVMLDKGVNIGKLTHNGNSIKENSIWATIGIDSGNNIGEFEAEAVILEGSKTNNFFEGIASVGTGVDKIEVLSRKEDGNLFDISLIKDAVSTISINDNVITTNGYFNSSRITMEDLKFIPGEVYSAYCNIDFKNGTETGVNGSIAFVSGNSTKYLIHKGIPSKNFIAPNNLKDWILVFYGRNDGVVTFTNLCITKSTETNDYIECKKDEKPLLFKDVDNNTWKPIPILPGYWEGDEFKWGDIVDTTQNKWYKRTNIIVLNGSENWQVYDVPDTNVRQFYIQPISVLAINDRTTINSVNDIFNDVSFNDRHISNTFNSLFVANNLIGVLKTKETSLESFKSELQAKNATVVYRLAEEKVFEVNPLFLESFEDETMVSVNSGVINAPIEFKIASYITNLVLLNQKRIKELENELYKTNLANFTVALNTLDTKLRLEQLTKAPR